MRKVGNQEHAKIKKYVEILFFILREVKKKNEEIKNHV